ncbi:MAG: histidine kinase [Butyrivibrio sp.]|nr:histidine kinase [Butyrivibrio sp.]
MDRRSKKDSFMRTITICVVSYLILMIVILSAVWRNTSATLEDGAGATLIQARDISLYQMDDVLKANEQALASVLQNNDNIKVFEYGTENQRAIAAQNMIQILQRSALTSSDVETLVFYDLVGDTYIAKTGDGITYEETVLIEKAVRTLKDENPGNMPSEWFYRKIGQKNYAVRMYKNKKRMLGALVEVSNLFDISAASDTITYTLTDEEGDVITQFGGINAPQQEDIDEGFIGAARWSAGKNFYITGAKSTRGALRIFVSMPRSRVYGGFQTLQVVLIGLVAAAILMLLLMALYTRKVVYSPLAELLSSMRKIENGDQNVRLSEDAATVEFQQINTSFNRMMDTIVNLRMRSYEERIAFDEATLKYVQLQIKPHFFLNALTTIHSMSFQNRNEEIREYIERLSRNIRYLFKSGLHAVSLSEEIEHARDYIAMQEILYPGCVFDFIEVEPGIEDYPIPQLLVHTILENIYKHAVSVDRLTSILISAKMQKKDGEEMCHLIVEDDGEGYPEEFLKEVAAGDVKVKDDGHGVGLWNMKKTLNLMYRRDDLMEFCNKEPHGTRVDVWLPRRVKRQSSLWTQS